jgi:hypothetical protein
MKLLKSDSLNADQKTSISMIIKRFSIFASLNSSQSQWLSLSNVKEWNDFYCSDMIENMQSSISIHDVDSFLIMWKLDQNGKKN